MERLTQKGFNYCYGCGRSYACEHNQNPDFPKCADAATYERLAAYEDTGLEPGDIVGLKNTCDQLYGINDSLFNANQAMGEDLAEWKKAEQEGRLVVLPCKVGDTVYKWGWKYSECHMGFTPSYKPCSECEGCCAECDSEKTAHLYSGNVGAIRIDRDGVLVQMGWVDKWDTSWYGIGKTVFLTREEAEAALRGDG